MRFVTVCTVAALVLAGWGGDGEVATELDEVFELRVEASQKAPSCGDPSCTTAEYVQWIAPEQGWWRWEHDDETGYRTIRAFAHGRYLIQDTVEIGSEEFLGSNPPSALDALRARDGVAVGDSFDAPCGQVRCTYHVADAMTLAEADARGIFDLAVDSATMVERQLAVGAAPMLPVKAYWFGPELEGRTAFTARESRSEEGVRHVTFYGDPNEIAAGRTHAFPGREVPGHEIQVLSKPVAQASRDIAELERHGPGQPVTLANGERAIAYRGAVFTDSTFVWLGLEPLIDMREVAPLLRPL